MAIEVVPVRSRRELRQFIEFPWLVYRGDPCWVPPLISEMKKTVNPRKNPFFDNAEAEKFLARDGTEVVGRIAAIINRRYFEFYDEKTGFFGLFETLPKYEIAEKLLARACEWLRSRGMDTARGPTAFSNTEEFGLLVEGFDDPPVVMMPYNPEYYIGFLERFGFTKGKTMLSYVYTSSPGDKPANLIKWIEVIQKQDRVRVRKADMKDTAREMAIGMGVYNAAWEKTWTFVPMTDVELEHLIGGMQKFMDPDLVFIAEVDGQPAGYAIAIPDLNQVLKRLNGRLFPTGFLKFHFGLKRVDTTRFLNQVVRPQYRSLGVAALLIYEMFHSAARKGYKKMEISWIMEDNLVVRGIFEKAGLKVRKRYALYDRALIQ